MKLQRSWGMLIDQLHNETGAGKPELKAVVYYEFQKEFNINKENKKDLNHDEWYKLVNFTLMWASRELGIYLLAPNEKPSKKIFNENT